MEIPARALMPSCVRDGPRVIATWGRKKDEPQATHSGTLEVEDRREVCKQAAVCPQVGHWTSLSFGFLILIISGTHWSNLLDRVPWQALKITSNLCKFMRENFSCLFLLLLYPTVCLGLWTWYSEDTQWMFGEYICKFAVVQSLSVAGLFVTPWIAACQVLCPPLSPGVCSNSCPLSQ